MSTAEISRVKEQSFIEIDGSNMPGPESGVVFDFDRSEGFSLTNESTRLLGWKNDPEKPTLSWLNSSGIESEYPVANLMGFTYLGADTTTGEPVVAFRYFKQDFGEEQHNRIVRLTGIAYGVHSGHMGVPERGIAPEEPGWYFIGYHVGDEAESNVSWESEPQEKVFPFSRVIDGPLGDPMKAATRDKYGLY